MNHEKVLPWEERTSQYETPEFSQIERMEAEIADLRAALAKSSPPTGFMFAPIEPTEAMVHAAEDLPAPRMFGKVYRAMLSAAPRPHIGSAVASQFKDEADLIAWLDGLYECNEAGTATNRKWEPAQRAIAGLRGARMAAQEAPPFANDGREPDWDDYAAAERKDGAA